MRHLPKHLRPRWRYLGVEIEAWPDAQITRGQFQRELYYNAQNLIGDVGSAEVDLSVFGFSFSNGDGAAVVRVRRGEVERGRAVIACIDQIDDQPVRVAVRGVGGTVRACEERYIRRPLETPEERTVAFENADRFAFVRERRIAVRTDNGFAGATDFDIE
ncbi:Rpp14/Pop5 family protein [Halocatena pleomorpha]|uniref:Ribonuclease P protein component 2 n=1 Tax=Halocatena pleomorpha TaxID=1785090 RepID=A0A3P3RJW9_9EURY|nr:Rpp14/Pop5 family protein [Halocatena pleomorpha]RRJ33624.1 ribonuclease P [Halocatena pleomorpha]